jgi:hypothetical protein
MSRKFEVQNHIYIEVWFWVCRFLCLHLPILHSFLLFPCVLWVFSISASLEMNVFVIWTGVEIYTPLWWMYHLLPSFLFSWGCLAITPLHLSVSFKSSSSIFSYVLPPSLFLLDVFLLVSYSRPSLGFCLHLFIKLAHTILFGAHSNVVGWGTMLQAGRSWDRVPMRWIFFNLPNPFSRTIALGSTQPRTEMSTRNLPGG